MIENKPFFPPLPGTSIPQILEDAARRHPEVTAVEFEGRHISYATLAERARNAGAALHAAGVRPGDRVGLMTANLPEFIEAFFGILMNGAAAVMYNVMLTPREIEHEARDSGTTVMLAEARLLPAILEGTADASELREIIVIGEAPEGHRDYDAFVSAPPGDFTPHKTALDDLALLVYTSGTTGKAKGAMLTHRNVLSNLAALLEMRPADEAAKVLLVLPLYHCFGLIAIMLLTVLRAGTLLLHRRFDAGAAIEALAAGGVTTFGGTPTMFFQMLNHPAGHGVTFKDLIRAGSGGAPMPAEVRTAFRERFGVDVTEGYGLTESTVSLCGYPRGLPVRAGSVGITNPGVEIRILGEDGSEVMIDEIGEIVARGPNIMAGYWNNPQATAEAVRDGWLHTGDLGYMNDKGYVFIVDRKKDMIIRGGFNIYPREIEEIIYELPGVHMAAVIGRPDAEKGEIPCAAVAPKAGHDLDAERIMEHLGAKLARYKMPELVLILPTLPVGPTGKILKRELRTQWSELLKLHGSRPA